MATVRKGTRRDQMVMFRLNSEELAEAKRRAEADGARTLSDWVRARVIEPGDLGSRVARIEAAIGLKEAN
jgi:hypothetical protein